MKKKKDKLTPKVICMDFKKTYPKLSKRLVHWYPRNVLEIVAYLDDGSKLVYSYEDRKASFLDERWKQI